MEIPRLWVESELQLPACITARATPDPSRIWELYYSSWQHQILNPLSKAHPHGYSLGSLPSKPQWELPSPCFILFYFIYFFVFSKAAPAAYGGFQARERKQGTRHALCTQHHQRGGQTTEATPLASLLDPPLPLPI